MGFLDEGVSKASCQVVYPSPLCARLCVLCGWFDWPSRSAVTLIDPPYSLGPNDLLTGNAPRLPDPLSSAEPGVSGPEDHDPPSPEDYGAEHYLPETDPLADSPARPQPGPAAAKAGSPADSPDRGSRRKAPPPRRPAAQGTGDTGRG